MLSYGWYLNRHHLTPAQVDELPAWFDARYPDFARVWDKVLANR